MIGTLDNAIACVMGEIPIFNDLGSSRNVFLVDGIIYKVEKEDYSANETEYERFLDLSEVDMPYPLMLPEFYLHRTGDFDVIAMPYIAGEAMGDCFCMPGESHFHCLPDNIRELARPYLGDTGGLNIIYDGLSYWLIDIEC